MDDVFEKGNHRGVPNSYVYNYISLEVSHQGLSPSKLFDEACPGPSIGTGLEVR